MTRNLEVRLGAHLQFSIIIALILHLQLVLAVTHL